MCRDSPKAKGHLLMDTIIGREGKAQGRDYIQIRHPRVVKACKLLLFFSEIFPKKFEGEFQLELLEESEQKNFGTNASDLLFDDKNGIGGDGTSPDIADKEFDWHKDHVLALEKYFYNNFDSVFEKIFVQEFFGIREDMSSA